jgi:hypothetical protein
VNRFNGTYPSFFVANGGHSAAGAQTLGVNAAFSLPTPFSLYIVCQHVGAADYGYVLDSGPGGSGRPYTYDGGIVNDTFATPFGEGGLVTTNPLLSVFNFASAASCYQNGSLQFTGSVSLTTGGITVGNRYSLNESWPGHICEYIMYNSVLNPAQRQQVEGYLAWKWGLQGSLPASHPYKNSLLPQLLNPPITNPIVVSGSWNPLKFTGCAFWVDAKVPAAFTPSTGGTLTAVRDLSPTPKTITITNTVTYRPNTEIVFTDTAGLFTLSGMPSAPYDYIFVGTANSSSATWRTMLRTASAPGTHPFVLQTGTNNAGMWNGSAFYQFGSLTQAPNEKSIFYGSMAADRTITASKNGTIVLTGPSPAGNESILTILGNSTGGGQPYGSLQEIVIYSRTLPTSQRQTLEGYLAWKWGLQTSLPGNHPFRNWPPAP